MNAALLLGALGTVLSAIALGWNIYRDLLDVGRLRVRCFIGDIHGAGTRGDNRLVWDVTNIGRRSVVVQMVAGTQKRDQTRFEARDRHFLTVRPLGNELPRRLEPGDYAHFWIEDLSQLPHENKIASLYAIDTLGRHFRASHADVRRVRDALREIRARQPELLR